MSERCFTYIWQYTINPGLESEFLAAYLPDGEWAKLFRKDPNYLQTELLRSAENHDQYMTIDYWTSQQARDTFRACYAEEFEALDKKCEAFTVSETRLGDFLALD